MNEELRIIIKAQTEQAQKNIKAAKDEVGKLSQEAEKGSGKFKAAMGKVGDACKAVAKVSAVAFGAAVAGIVGLTKSAVDNYAEYEQLIGGVETLFKNSAGIVKGYADEAYKSAGMSANEYMTTITSFSASLLQSLDGDTKKAAEAGNQAVIDMSDNANKMGTNIESIQNAYQGFAKQNYTMLDNLKLGYGGTKEEMERLLVDAEKLSGVKYDITNLSDVYSAIHTIQTELGITGTTAKEAGSTIQGSAAAMKSSWSNLVTGIADENADFDTLLTNFIDSVGTFAENLIPRIEVALGGIVKLIDGLAPKIAKTLPKLVSTLLPKVIQAATNIITSVAKALPSLINSIIQVIPQLIDGIITAFTAIVQSLPKIIEAIVAALPTLIPALINGIVTMILILVENIMDIINPIIEALPNLIITIIDALMSNLPMLIEGLITLILALVDAIPEIIQALVDAIPTVISMIIDGLLSALPQIIAGLLQVVWGVVKAIPQIFASLIEAIINVFAGIWDGLGKVFAKVGSWFKNTFSGAVKGIKEAFSSIGNWFAGIWNGIKNVFSSVGKWFSNIFTGAWNGIKNAFSAVGNFFTGIWNNIKSIFSKVGKTIGDAVSGAFKSAINWVLEKAVGLINGFIKSINWCIGIINKIPGVEIGKIGLLEVPKFAKGGIVDSATIAMIGEQGKEAVVPLENNTEWMDKLAARLNTNSNKPIYLMVDKKVLGEASSDGINDITRLTGKVPLVLV